MPQPCNCWCGCFAPANMDGLPTCAACQFGTHAVPVEFLPGDDWASYSNDMSLIECDDCFRTDGTHNLEVEH